MTPVLAVLPIGFDCRAGFMVREAVRELEYEVYRSPSQARLNPTVPVREKRGWKPDIGVLGWEAPRSVYDFWVAGIEVDTKFDAGDRKAEPRRVDRGEKEKAWSRKSGGNEDERSQDSGDHVDGRSEESLDGETRVRGGEDQTSGRLPALTPSHLPGGTWLNKVWFLLGGGKSGRKKIGKRDIKGIRTTEECM
ncbi:hypothetical protein NDU88_002908 [Pleurodeles waltl]|uniref:Uncharacterized protein n=1 Tax=Pleurodeles waltl TaxID=8319 RepID=A0AAV7L0D0_PLEWA|nr:hypothetical protein NDU88_002908 [Pleurodeles waltl]